MYFGPLQRTGGLVNRIFQKSKGLKNALMKDPPFLGKRDPIANAIKQLQIQCIFERFYLPTDSALGDAKLLGCSSDAEAIADDGKCS